MIQAAIRAAKKSPKKFKHASLVLKGGAILSIGYNHDKIHSEISALKKLWPNKRRGCTVLNIRIMKNNNTGNSYPCKECMKFMKKNKVSRVTYSLSNNFFLTERI